MKWNEVKSEANNDVLSRTATLTGGFDFQPLKGTDSELSPVYTLQPVVNPVVKPV